MRTCLSLVAATLLVVGGGSSTVSARTIRTVSAVYGNLATQHVCNATAAVASACDGREQCVVGIGNGSLCGDPDFLTVKKARIDYRCGRSIARSVIADECTNANIACE